MELYRATNRSSDARNIPAGSCWTDRREHAEAYTANQGYGGRYIVRIDVADADIESALDLRGSGWINDDFRALSDALGYDPRDGWTDGDLEYPEQAIDSAAIRAELAAAGYEWVIYHDTFPANCTTYVKL